MSSYSLNRKLDLLRADRDSNTRCTVGQVPLEIVNRPNQVWTTEWLFVAVKDNAIADNSRASVRIHALKAGRGKIVRILGDARNVESAPLKLGLPRWRDSGHGVMTANSLIRTKSAV